MVFRTDPKLNDYVVERGAKRNTDPWKRGLDEEVDESDDARLDRLEREMAEVDGEAVQERNAMADLEAKTADAKREMAVADALDEIRSRNARIEKAHRDGVEIEVNVVVPEDELRRKQEEEDAEAARRAFARRHALLEEVIEDDAPPSGSVNGNEESSSSGSSTSAATTSTEAGLMLPPPRPVSVPSTDMPPPSFKRQVKKKKDHSALLGIKKKQSLV